MIATLVATGAFHEDGLADAVDGLGGGLDRNRALEIMKDSRIGAFGAIALGLALLLKFVTLNSVPSWQAALLLLAGHAVSRLGAVFIMTKMPYARETDDSRSKPLVQHVSSGVRGDCHATGIAALLPLRWAGVPMSGYRPWRARLPGMGAVFAAAVGWVHRRLPRRGSAVGRMRVLLGMHGGLLKRLILVRHTQPALAEGICYGRMDLDLAPTWPREFEQCLAQIPAAGCILSSPSSRCLRLAQALGRRDGVDVQVDAIGCWS
jgi:hypothetical protein